MKNIVLIIFAFILVIGGTIWYLKPTETVASVKETTSLKNMNKNKELRHPSEQSSLETQFSSHSSSQSKPSTQQHVELVDTKSDPSIKPIDPEKDPGNQVLDSK